MSRVTADNDYDPREANLWHGRLLSAIRGARGQAFLRELLEALDAMPEKRLIANSMQAENGEVCALGVIGAKRGIDLHKIDESNEGEDYDAVKIGKQFNIAEALALEIMWFNDDGIYIFHPRKETPEHRWGRMRAWVLSHLKPVP